MVRWPTDQELQIAEKHYKKFSLLSACLIIIDMFALSNVETNFEKAFMAAITAWMVWIFWYNTENLRKVYFVRDAKRDIAG